MVSVVVVGFGLTRACVAVAGVVAVRGAVPPAPAGLPVRARPLLADPDVAAPDCPAGGRRRAPLQPAHRRRVAAEGLRLAARGE